MKIISRKLGEKIVIDGHITVTVKTLDAEKLVLTIESPESDLPYREELILLDSEMLRIPEPLTR